MSKLGYVWSIMNVTVSLSGLSACFTLNGCVRLVLAGGSLHKSQRTRMRPLKGSLSLSSVKQHEEEGVGSELGMPEC